MQIQHVICILIGCVISQIATETDIIERTGPIEKRDSLVFTNTTVHIEVPTTNGHVFTGKLKLII